MDVVEFLTEFQDFLAPKLDTYEQAIYLYLFRHSRLIGQDNITIGFKSARARMACGIGEKGKPMSEGTAYIKLASLQDKGCLNVLRTTHSGREIHLILPNEINGLIPLISEMIPRDLESMDFFNIEENRKLLLMRENFRCFYTLKKLDAQNFVVEHVVSRPQGDNSYKNCVAASREANNKKGNRSAEDFIRQLFRDRFLNEAEFDDRLRHLSLLRSGELKPVL